ncbi:NADPH-dependent enal/enone/nitroreductase, Oye family [Basidiobolus meristosporus CBS 931.73]|uniref:NADPH-dependent enal/enone/nitroreductase, Oye family n=1 Tax=Basidiobolus meristosporus CBS 931.73 TaxID=1314790 RepID=A0A1Y1XZD5_9FUNG|nr:NADPH-dependent enal/enone/nitroreductase, Oye family [Basidiobolus meristosporus CBS 931.73]|eukprot:ORX90856.1 NADPH-dependent enal/enone/nitroreductase, Oye family [Basidiobolus meristosporus CBS 931.73]
MTITPQSGTQYIQLADPTPGTAMPTHQGPIPGLFKPLTIRNVTLKNRIAVAPMCTYSASDGFMNDFHLVHLGQYATYGVGLIIVEATAVLPNGRITPNCAGLWKDEHMVQMKRIVDYIHGAGSTAGIQIGHAGRKASTPPPFVVNKSDRATLTEAEGGWDDLWAPSPIGWDDGWAVPHEMALKDIAFVKQAFVDAAIRADKIGYDVLEIHGAHGYLISEFLSPLSNQRTDQYGGSFENRIRLAVEIIEAVRQVWPAEKPLFFRISSYEWVEGGWSAEDTVEFAKKIHPLGVDLLDCSTGGNSSAQKIAAKPGFQVPYAEKVKHEVPGILTGAVGLITKAAQANSIVESDRADLVLLGREFLRNPTWTLQAAQELGVDVNWPAQYGYCSKPRH